MSGMPPVDPKKSDRESSADAAPRQRENWWTRNFFWCAPAIALGVVVMMVFLCIGAFTMLTGLGDLRPLRDMAYERVVAHPAVQQRMPGQIEMGRGFQAPVRGTEMQRVPLRIPIRTEEEAAEILVVGERGEADGWRMVYLAVVFTGGERLWIIKPDDPDWDPFDEAGTPGRPDMHQPSNGG